MMWILSACSHRQGLFPLTLMQLRRQWRLYSSHHSHRCLLHFKNTRSDSILFPS